MSTPRQTYEQNCRFFAAETRQNPGGPCLSTTWNCVLLNCLKATPLFDINPFVTRGDGPRTQVQERGWRVKLRPFRHRPGAPSISDRLFLAPEPLRMSGSEPSSVGTWLSLVEHSLGVRGVGSSNLPVPTIQLLAFSHQRDNGAGYPSTAPAAVGVVGKACAEATSQIEDDLFVRLRAADEQVTVGRWLQRFGLVSRGARNQSAFTGVAHARAARPSHSYIASLSQFE